PCAVAVGDCIIESTSSPPLERLLDTHTLNKSAATVLVEYVEREKTGLYGIVAAADDVSSENPFRFTGIIEKPEPLQAPSQWAVAARWVLSPAVFRYIRSTMPRPSSEIYLTEPVDRMLSEGASSWAVSLRPGE